LQRAALMVVIMHVHHMPAGLVDACIDPQRGVSIRSVSVVISSVSYYPAQLRVAALQTLRYLNVQCT
jgi:hypothetical protein